ncbi:MAG: PAS domain S-box protein, partial [Acidimicrobiia bacterium]
MIADLSHHVLLLDLDPTGPSPAALEMLAERRSTTAELLDVLVHGDGPGRSVAEEMPEIYDGPEGLAALTRSLLVEIDAPIAFGADGSSTAVNGREVRAQVLDDAAAAEALATAAVQRLSALEEEQTRNAFADIAALLMVMLGSAALAAATVVQRRKGRLLDRAATAQFDAIFNHAPNPMLVTTCDAVIERVNPAFAAALGRSVEDLVGRPVIDFIVPEDHSAFIDEIATPYALLADRTSSRQFVTADGSVRHMTRALTPLPERRGSARYLASYTDVTDLESLIEELRDRKSTVRSLVDAIPDLVARLDKDLVYTEVHRGTGPDSGIVLPEAGTIGPEYWGPAYTDRMLAAREEARRTGSVVSMHWAPINPAGQRRILEVRVSAIGEDTLLIGRDVTELRALADETKRVADEHAAVLRALPDAVVVVGNDLSVSSSFIPPGFVFPRFDQATDAGLTVYGSDALTKYLVARETSLQTGAFAGWVGESIMADGSSRWFEVRVMALASGGIAVLRDVTEDLAIRQRAIDSEGRLRAIIDAFPATVLVARRDGTIETFHSHESQFRDLDLTTLVGRSIADIFGDDHLKDFQHRFEEASSEGGTIRFDTMYVTHGGHLVHENHFALVDSETAVVMSLDVTEARSTQHALTEREALLRTLTDSAPIAIGLLDGNGLLLTANPHLEELTGASLAQLAGTGYLDHVHPGDLDHVAEHGALAIAEGRSYDHSIRVIRTDGQIRWAQIRTAPTLDDEDRPTGAVLTVIDATAEKLLAEQNDQLADVISATSDMVVVTDMLGGILYANEAAQFFREEGQWFSDMLTPESARVYAFEALPAAQSFGSWTGELLYRNGESPVPVSQLVVVTNDSNGEATSVAHIGRDISDLKAVEPRLEHLASHDVLTGLPNRRMCMQRIDHALARSGRNETAAALI